jgi:hypothetical protein
MAEKPQPTQPHDRPSDRARSMASSPPSTGNGHGHGEAAQNREAKHPGGRDIEVAREAIHRTYR